VVAGGDSHRAEAAAVSLALHFESAVTEEQLSVGLHEDFTSWRRRRSIANAAASTDASARLAQPHEDAFFAPPPPPVPPPAPPPVAPLPPPVEPQLV
jgi:hypothetical protein